MVDLAALVQECGARLYDSEVVRENDKMIYRVYITSPDGVNLDLCQKVSELLSPIFDVEPPVSGEYFLEVSSPGLERNLKSKEHFAMSVGELVSLKFSDENGQNTVIKGELISTNDDEICIKSAQGEIKIPYTKIKKAKTYIEW